MIDYRAIIDKYYESGSKLYQVLTRHSMQVADLAVSIAKRLGLPLDADDIYAAAMLHDIGIVYTHAPSIYCLGDKPYICHGIIGGKILRDEGLPEWVARVAERHTGAGLTRDDIIAQKLPLPLVDYVPETLLEKLICYADKFYSKSGDMRRKPFDKVCASMARHGADTLRRFDALHGLFGSGAENCD